MRVGCVALGAVLAAAVIACPQTAAVKRWNVVLITADTLRADHLGCYGYFRQTSPAIDALAAESLLFERVVVPIATTLPSHVSLMTSTPPLRHGVLWNKPFQEHGKGARPLRLAAQMFAGAGYATAAFTSAAPVNESTGIQTGFQTFAGVSPSRADEVEKSAEHTIASAIDWLSGARSPFFLWIHLFDPHAPYAPPPPFDRAFPDAPALSRFFDERRFPLRMRSEATGIANRYDGEILYMDGQIRRLFDRLKELGLYDDALIVFTADHGEGLLQHGYEGHGIVWNEQLLVPLIIKAPKATGVRPGRNAALASLIDVLPTMVDVADLPIAGDQFEGSSLLNAPRRFVLSQQQWAPSGDWNERIFTLTTERWKYFHHPDALDRDRLYDLAADPYETRNVVGEHPQAAVGLRRQVAELLRASDGEPAFATGTIPDAVREQLRQLGYVD